MRNLVKSTLTDADPISKPTFKDKTLFDDKVLLTPEYQWDGVKGGAAWKSRVERYFITKAPVLRELLECAEA